MGNELIVELAVEKESLQRTYRSHGTTWACEAEALSSIEGRGRKAKLKILDLLALLEERDLADLDKELSGERLDALGDLLLKVLFGSDEHTLRRALDNIYEEEGRWPTYEPVRVRIIAHDDRFVALPWMATQWRTHLLIDKAWTFEGCLEETGTSPACLMLPPKVLVVAPELGRGGDATLASEAHVREITGLIEAMRPGWTAKAEHFHVVSSFDEEPIHGAYDVLYYYGHGQLLEGQASLQMAHRDVLVRDLFRQAPGLQGHPPSLVLLNACSVGRAGWHSAGNHLCNKGASLVVANVSPSYADVAREFAMTWLTAVLKRRQDPVKAAHDRAFGRGASSYTFSNFATVAVTSRLGAWSVRRLPGVGGHERLKKALDLDREAQRAVFKERIEKMLDERSPVRMQVAVAYGPPGNLMEHASVQLCEHVEKKLRDESVQINKYHLRPGANDALDRLALERAIRTLPAARALHPFSMGAAIRALAPDDLSDGARRVAWLDGGLLRMKAPFASERLDAFLGFMRDTVGSTVEGIHAIASIAVEVDPGEQSALEKHLRALAVSKGWLSGVRLSVLAPFGEAPVEELIHYLEDAGCSPGVAPDLGEALMTLTGGRYGDLVKELDRVETLGSFEAVFEDVKRRIKPDGKS